MAVVVLVECVHKDNEWPWGRDAGGVVWSRYVVEWSAAGWEQWSHVGVCWCDVDEGGIDG
jgi:hypothetical protein